MSAVIFLRAYRKTTHKTRIIRCVYYYQRNMHVQIASASWEKHLIHIHNVRRTYLHITC